MKDDWYINNIAKTEICAVIHSPVVRKSVSLKIFLPFSFLMVVWKGDVML